MLIRNTFQSESIRNVSKRIPNRQSRNRKFFPLEIFSWDLVFSAKMIKIVKKLQSQKILVEIFFVGIASECFETYFKTKISQSKIFSRVKFFSWGFVFFGQIDQKSEKMTKSKNFGRIIFLVRIDSERFETNFKTKISKSKIFSRVNFL